MKYLFVYLWATFGPLACGSLEQQWLLSAATSSFSQELYQKVAGDKSSVVYSPYSVHSALSMTSLGARGETANEMAKLLHLLSLGDSTHQIYRELITELYSTANDTLTSANAIFINPEKFILPEYVAQVKTNYLAKVDHFDMSAPEGPEKVINDFVAENTDNQIQDILPKGTIEPTTVIVLVNAVHFNNTWDTQFLTKLTKPCDFYQLGGAVIKVPMMNNVQRVMYKSDNSLGVEVVELPFTDRRFSFYIALPLKIDGITDLEKLILFKDKVNMLFTGLSYKILDLSIPKFKIESTLDLIPPLKSLGLIKAFSPTEADFSGITNSGQAYINNIIHKTVIDVTETGTTAAAGSAVVLSVRTSRPRGLKFHANHPFVFFLRDNTNQQIYFQGKFSG
ncbi:leukocyte elastase inhibitor-like [Physella acuta]|uniref:leukocyte elastase inhibitor-like n=1 Tax=Physella acuta TaxID=109671 RepID=UPI0027DCF01B|nr:leukocyte elastase inhibitor-like [Physella acuta]XP_059179577.1 leukocyte elastase inhibitor-like [Physella acuta]XP_059179579.1 leukocyte elastase inhibitor-like [Physella acuta]